MTNISQFLEYQRIANPDIPAIYYHEDKYITYAELHQEVVRLCSGFRKLGLVEGDRIGISLANNLEFIIAYLAIHRAGMVVVPYNPMFKEKELRYQLMDSRTVAMICNERTAKLVNAITVPMELDILTIVPSYNDQSKLVWQGLDTGEKLLSHLSDVEPDFPAVISYTAAMDGYPRGAVLTHRSISANREMNIIGMKTSFHDVYLAAIPLFHTYGAMANFLAPLYVGASVYLLPRFNPKEFLELVESRHITAITAVPTMYAGLMFYEGFDAAKLANCRILISGGAALPDEIFTKFQEVGLQLLQGYGLTECSPAVSVNPVDGENKMGSIGLPLKGVEIKIVDHAGNALPKNQEGELLVKGDLVMKCYLHDGELTKKSIDNGWLHTGDKAYIDEDGYIFLTGRLKEMVLSGGFNVYPKEVERLLSAHPAIEKITISGVPNLVHGELVKATVTRKPGVSLSLREFNHFAKRTIALYKVPRIVEFTDERA